MVLEIQVGGEGTSLLQLKNIIERYVNDFLNSNGSQVDRNIFICWYI